MAEILLLHHAMGLTTGVHEFAGALRDFGHTVHTPDLFGRTFATVEEGVDFEENSIGWEGMLKRTEAAAEALAEQVPLAEINVYEGSTHLFADPSSDDFDATAAALAIERIQVFL